MAAIVDFGVWPRAAAENQYMAEHEVLREGEVDVRRLDLEEVALILSTLAGASSKLARAAGGFLRNGPAGKPVGPTWWLSGKLDSLLRLPGSATRIGSADRGLGQAQFLDGPIDEETPRDAVARGLQVMVRSAGYLG